MKANSRSFGFTKEGEEVLIYTLKNDFLEVEILNYGGIIKKIATKDREGKLENIVLAFDTIEEYQNNSPYLGCITGRVAGRLEGGEFPIGDEIFQLEKNSGNNHIHGGVEGLDKKIWRAVYIESETKKILNLTYNSKHLEGGYPGNVVFEVTYTIFENTLTIDYLGIPDRATYINLTNHTYFNLSGNNRENILNHKLEVAGESYISVDKSGLPQEVVKMESSEINFIQPREIREVVESGHRDIDIVGGGLDHPFILEVEEGEERASCILTHDVSGRVVEVFTDQPVLVIYTGNFLDSVERITDNVESKKHMGIALEAQDYTNIFKRFVEKLKIYTPSSHYRQHTIFRFTNN